MYCLPLHQSIILIQINFMKTLLKHSTITFTMIFAVLLFNSCLKDEVTTPTRTRMQGVWKVTEAYDQSGNSILSKIQFPVAGFYLTSDNTVVSTGGPMFMYEVYGANNYTNIASKVDQVFNYASLNTTDGEFFVADGVVDRFTIEMKLKGLPGQSALTTLLSMMNIQSQFLDETVYHKFLNVKVGFNTTDVPATSVADVMTWEFDNTTTALYNTKDSQGNYVLWGGFPIATFSKCRFVLTKQTTSLTDMVKNAPHK